MRLVLSALLIFATQMAAAGGFALAGFQHVKLAMTRFAGSNMAVALRHMAPQIVGTK